MLSAGRLQYSCHELVQNAALHLRSSVTIAQFVIHLLLLAWLTEYGLKRTVFRRCDYTAVFAVHLLAGRQGLPVVQSLLCTPAEFGDAVLSYDHNLKVDSISYAPVVYVLQRTPP